MSFMRNLSHRISCHIGEYYTTTKEYERAIKSYKEATFYYDNDSSVSYFYGDANTSDYLVSYCFGSNNSLFVYINGNDSSVSCFYNNIEPYMPMYESTLTVPIASNATRVCVLV